MHRSIETHELTRIDLSAFHVVQISDGRDTVVLWEAPFSANLGSTREEAFTLTIRLPNPLDAMRRKDVCERLQAHLTASRQSAARRRVQALAA
jgi:hypothetical protein